MIRSCALAFALLTGLAVEAGAQTSSKGKIQVIHPWTRATPGGATVGAGAVRIMNTGTEPDRLLGGSFDGAASVEVHEMKIDGDILRMRRLADGLEIPPGATIELKPGSYHLMFVGLNKPIVQGADVKGTLLFKNAGEISVQYRVEPVGATESPHD